MYANPFLIFKIACLYEFLNEGTHNVKRDQLICQNSQRATFVHRLATTFLLPDQLTDQILLCHAISHLIMVSAELRDAYQFCVSTKAERDTLMPCVSYVETRHSYRIAWRKTNMAHCCDTYRGSGKSADPILHREPPRLKHRNDVMGDFKH
jgi:hypothetical protein